MWILVQLVDGTTPSPKPPPWTDPAPYLPHDHDGGGYGYAMLQYHFKKKSGHARPKHGGECEPITPRTMTFWLARTSFSAALLHTIWFWLVSLGTTVFIFGLANPTVEDPPSCDEFSEVSSNTSPGTCHNRWTWWRSLSGTLTLLKLQVGSHILISYIGTTLGKLPSKLAGYIRKDGSRPRAFLLWVRSFHWNFSQYLPAYL